MCWGRGNVREEWGARKCGKMCYGVGGGVLAWRKVGGNVGRDEGIVWGGGEKMLGRCEKVCCGVGEGVGSLLGSGEMTWGNQDVEGGEKCGKR